MLDIGLPELIIILGVALIVLGPQKLPEIARSLGKALSELRRTSDDLRRNILLGEGLGNDTYYPPKTAAVRETTQESSHTNGKGNPQETRSEKGITQEGTSETTQTPSKQEG